GRKNAGPHATADDLLRLRDPCEVDRQPDQIRGYIAKTGRMFPPRVDPWRRHERARRNLTAPRIHQQNQPVGVGVWEWFYKYRIDQRGDRGRRTDAAGHRRENDDGHCRRPQEGSNGVPQVGPEGVHRAPLGEVYIPDSRSFARGRLPSPDMRLWTPTRPAPLT